MAELVTKYQQYEEYKDSGVEWLGEVPTHWEVVPIKHLAILNPKKSTLSQDLMSDECSFVPMEKLKFNSLVLDEKKVVKDVYDGYTYFENEDILVAKVTPCFENNNTTIAKDLINGVGFGSSEIFVLRVNDKVNNRYLFYRLLETIFISVATAAMTGAGGLRRVPAETINTYSIAVPDTNEQTQIANFLDHETAQIDTLIDKQQILIQLLKEKRQAVISHAVTKGLNPDAPMKDSGVEWLGDVPEHWNIVKLKWKASTTSGGTPTTSKYEDYYEDGDIPWIRTTDLNNDKLNETPIMITPKAVRDSACSLLPKNSVLIAMYGGAGSIGKHSLLRFESTINQAVCGVLPSEAFVPDYLHRFYEFYRPFWMIGAAGTRKDPNIGQDNIKEARIPIPPLNEQYQIADYLDKMQNHFDALTENAEQAIQLMQERRTALISAAVTGKIDVRGWRASDVL